MMKKLKVVVSAIVFLGIGVFLFFQVSYVLRPIDNTSVRSRIAGFYALSNHSLDIATIGSSSVYRYVDVPFLYAKFGYTSYTFGTPGQSFYAYKELIKEIKKTQDPGLFIIDSRRYIKSEPNKIINTKRLLELAGNMKYSGNRMGLVKKMSMDIKDPLPYYFDIVTYHSAWTGLKMENFEYLNNSRVSPSMGWQNMPEIMDVTENDVSDMKQERQMTERAESQLRDLCSYCEENEIPVLFLGTAYQITKEQKQVSNTFRKIVESYGFQFLECNDYYDEMNLDFHTDFYNESHTNCIGARKHTIFLGEYIEEHYAIEKNHRESVTEQWEEAAASDEIIFLQRYQTMKKKAEKMGYQLAALETLE